MASQSMLEKLELAAPYNIFYNTVSKLPQTSNQSNSITFAELLCPSLGKLKCSLQITSKLDIEWLMKHYDSRGLGDKPLTILHGEEKPEMEEYIKNNLPNVTPFCVGVVDRFGSHHCKMGIYVYEDKSLRVVISSSNLYENHFDHFHHGFWVSPLCPPLPASSPSYKGDSPTRFKSDLLTYFHQYNLPVLHPWIDYIKGADFSDVRVFLVTSYPGSHSPSNPGTHLQKMEMLLKTNCDLPKDANSWPIVIQSSCIGQYGDSPQGWLRPFLLKSLAWSKGGYSASAPFQVIYPTVKEVEEGVFGREIGEGLRYLKDIHERQSWVKEHMFKWKSDDLGRSGVMPHSKIYCRMSPCCTKMGWFLMTSANATRGAWGMKKFQKQGIFMRNYEVGVLFLPKFFGKEYFEVQGGDDIFPVPFDLPLKKYEAKDEPWTVLEVGQMKQKVIPKTEIVRLALDSLRIE